MRRQPLARRASALRLALVLLALFAALALPASTQAQSPYVASIISVSGAVMGTATFTPTSVGTMVVDLRVTGFDPVSGTHRFAITNVGICCPPTLSCAGQTIALLPEVQFFSDGSAAYHVVTGAISVASLTGRYGSALLLHANSDPQSAIIACGVIVSPFSTPPIFPPPAPPAIGPVVTVIAPAGLNLRQGPGLGEPRILVLRRGETVTLTGERALANGIEWVRATAFRGGASFVGWAAAVYLSGAGATPPPQTVANVRVTAQAGLRLRAGPGLGFGIRRIVPVGTRLRATGARSFADGYEWSEVVVDGLTLWAASTFLAPL